eukprot:CAMPEP_0195075088 /NCGR_PEP_ID=MMETSP0448-20130528/18046_1 /TAXON_ID=66468 /ORGANISM="Heterocapsa triquestra, Strain CCMP 448" /LENGTH=141 /DNA_ID=CAMNT_0040107431 /DNA_START=54 /DNA_END=477 /DNA_ORIENTATION=+
MEHTLHLPNELENGGVYKYTGPEAKRCVDALVELAQGMLKASPQDLEHETGCIHEHGGRDPTIFEEKSDDGETKTIVGADAIEQVLEQATGKLDEGSLRFDGLSTLHAFHWLLDDERQQELERLTKTLVASIKHGHNKVHA